MAKPATRDILKKDLNGKTVESHLHEIIAALVTHNRQDALTSFEVLSRFIKTGAASADIGEPEGVGKTVDAIFASRKVPTSGEGEEAAAAELKGVPNVTAELDLTKWAGFGFSAADVQALSCSFMHLAGKEGVEQVRFWGKILGQKADYIVAEGKFAGEQPEVTDEEKAEGGMEKEMPGEQGMNFYTYWVTTTIYATADDWVMLPLAKPAQVVASRKVKKILTGDLNAPVVTQPYFPGKEDHLLRAMIADISANTILAPAGKFVKGEGGEGGDDRAVLEASEADAEKPFVMPPAKQLVSLDAWVHSRENILGSGKTLGVNKEDAIAAAGDEPEAIAQATRLVEETLKNDPFIDPLLPVSMDKPPEGMTASWSVTRVCDPAEMTVPDKPSDDGAPTSKTISNAVVAVKSMVWPGAVTVCRNEEFVSVYMGYGHKVGTYFPVAPPEVLDEPEDFEDGPEPQAGPAVVEDDGGGG
jgi:radial spoke head protein 4A